MTLLTTDRTTVETVVPVPFIKGRRYQECPRRGYSILTKYDGKRVIIQTRCKQKGCVPCRPAVRAHVALKAEIGNSIRPHSYFITLTLRMATKRAKDALFVQKVWRAFCQRLKYETSWWEQVKWMKVIELTAKGQPHLHLMVTGVPGGKFLKCKGNKNQKDWVDNGCFRVGESCVHHEVAKAWARVTEKLGNESWIVDVSKVRSNKKAGLYVAKYIAKGGEDAERLARLGFKRVWSASKDFTPDLRIRLRGTVEGKWERVEYWQPQKDPDSWLAYSDGDRDLELVGHPLVMQKYRARERQQRMEFVLGVLNNGCANIQQANYTKGSRGQYGQGGRVRAVANRSQVK